jgi:hypothetical protein
VAIPESGWQALHTYTATGQLHLVLHGWKDCRKKRQAAGESIMRVTSG